MPSSARADGASAIVADKASKIVRMGSSDACRSLTTGASQWLRKSARATTQRGVLRYACASRPGADRRAHEPALPRRAHDARLARSRRAPVVRRRVALAALRHRRRPRRADARRGRRRRRRGRRRLRQALADVDGVPPLHDRGRAAGRAAGALPRRQRPRRRQGPAADCFPRRRSRSSPRGTRAARRAATRSSTAAPTSGSPRT